MGTEINLKVGGILLSFSRNHMGIDFGHLFQGGDRTRRRTEQINYEYYVENSEEAKDLEIMEMSFVRSLGQMVPRLNLLNHSLDAARVDYEAVISEAAEMAPYDDRPKEGNFLTFEEFCALSVSLSD